MTSSILSVSAGHRARGLNDSRGHDAALDMCQFCKVDLLNKITVPVSVETVKPLPHLVPLAFP